MSGEEALSDRNRAVLASITLDAHEWRGLEKLAEAFNDFEPIGRFSRLGMTVVQRLLSYGIAEQAPVSAPMIGQEAEPGYRLSPLGWQIYERGRYPRWR